MDDNGRDEKFQRLLFEMSQLLKRDDVRGFVKFLDNNPEALQAPLVVHCSMSKAKNCLTALVNGRICEPPLAPEGGFAAISIHLVAYFFPDPDIIKIMLEKGATVDLNRECTAVFADEYGTPLYLALASIDSSRRGLHLPLDSWRIGDSIYKLIILLCMWEPKRHLDSVRLLACLNESVNYLAWNLLQNGKLKQLAALLLVAPEEVMAPLETGMTIQQHLANEIESLSSKVDFSHERAQHKSMLMDARQLFDVIERTGDALSSYRTSMLKRIPPEKVLTDVVGLLKRAGFSLQLRDIDLRDCYSGCLALWKPCLDKLADKSRPANNLLHPNPGMTFANIQCRHWNPLLGMLKEGKLLDIVSPIQRVPNPQMLNTVAGSSVLLKHLAYAAFKLKRGSRIL